MLFGRFLIQFNFQIQGQKKVALLFLLLSYSINEEMLKNGFFMNNNSFTVNVYLSDHSQPMHINKKRKRKVQGFLLQNILQLNTAVILNILYLIFL